MDKIDKNFKTETLIQKIEKVEQIFPNLNLPNMGMIEQNNKIHINGKDFFKNKSTKEE